MMKYNNIKKIIFSVIMSITLMISLGMTSFAKSNPEVSFGKNITFKSSTGDLFSGFKKLLPGETRTQQVSINNTSSDSAKFYLRVAASEQQQGLTDEQKDLVWDLIHNKIKIKVSDINGTVVYDGSVGGSTKTKTPNDITQDSLFLGELAKNTAENISIEIMMDGSVDNKYQGLSGSVKWIFIVEQNGSMETIEIDDGNVPLANLPNIDGQGGSGDGSKFPGSIVNTGDPVQIIMWGGLLVSVVIAFTVVTIIKSKKAKETQE